MLPNLSSVLNSLVTVIIRYHDSQHVAKPMVASRKPEDFHKKADELLKEPTSLISTLEDCINQCTTALNYTNRNGLLLFLLSQVNYLNDIVNREKSFDENELKAIYERLSQLVIDARQLLNTYKGTPCTVRNSNGDWLKLDGLHATYSYCNSGLILQEELLQRLYLNPQSKDEEIRQTCQGLCDNFNNSLLAKEKIQVEEKMKAREEEWIRTKDENEQLRKEREAPTSRMDEEKEKLEERIANLEKELKRVRQENTTLRSRTSSIHPNAFGIVRPGFFVPPFNYFNTHSSSSLLDTIEEKEEGELTPGACK